VRRLGIGSSLGLLVLGQALLWVTANAFVAIAMFGRGIDHAAAVQLVTRDPLTLGAAQLAALGAVIALGTWLFTPGEEPLPALGVVPARVRYAVLAAVAGAALQLPMVELTTQLVHAIPAFAHPHEADLAIEEVTRVSSPLRAITVPFTFVLVAPVTEELLFRGLILRALKARYGRGAAIGLSALLFGAFHVDPQALVFASLVGLVLGWVAERARSTMPSIAMHAAFNALPILFPRELVEIPGFNDATSTDLPWALVLVSSVVAAAALGALALLFRRDEPA
jgi:membrane protease YdiL (CAAX protease family)